VRFGVYHRDNKGINQPTDVRNNAANMPLLYYNAE